MDRVERLMTIPAVGPITALTWALEVGEVQPFFHQESHQLLRAVWGGEEFRQHGPTHAAVKTAQQTFTDDADRGGKNGAAKQPGTSHAL
jgi:hypothetical protein